MPPEDNITQACSDEEGSREHQEFWPELVRQESMLAPSTPRLESTSPSPAGGSPEPQEKDVQLGASETPGVDIAQMVPDEDPEKPYVFTIGSDPADDSESVFDFSKTNAGASVLDEILAMFDDFTIGQDPPEESVFGPATSKERLGL